MKQSPLLYGVLLVLASELTFALISALIKYLSNDVSHVQLVFFRNLFALIPLLPWLIKHRSDAMQTSNFKLHLLRGLTGVGAMFIYTYVITTSNLVNAAMMLLLAPFFIPLIAHFWLRQYQNSATAISILIGFSGAYLCLTAKMSGQINGIELSLAMLILFGSMLTAISKSTISKMSKTEPSKRIVCYFSLIALFISAIFLPFDWQPLSWTNLALLVLLGITASLGQLMMTKAFTIAGASTIGLFSYSSILFAAILGALWWQQFPQMQWYVGASTIVIAGVVAFMFPPKKLQHNESKNSDSLTTAQKCA